MHVVSWNLENLASYLGDAPKHAPLSDVVRALGAPDVLCLQELKLRPQDSAAAENALEGYGLVHSLADDPKNAKFRGGRTYGVGIYVREGVRATILDRPAWDREGRVAGIVVGDVAVIDVYAVNGTDKPHWDHDLGRVEGDRHAWKRRFHEHLSKLVRSLKRDVLLIGDFNVSQARIDITPRLRTEEPHATSRAHFAKNIVEDLDLVDVFRVQHPEARAYTWFNARARRLDAARVDFALLSRHRLSDVIEASISEERFGSDHAPLHVRIRTRADDDVRASSRTP